MVDNCGLCHEDVTDDGHGELVHVIERAGVMSFKYGCKPGTKDKEYPVAV